MLSGVYGLSVATPSSKMCFMTRCPTSLGVTCCRTWYTHTWNTLHCQTGHWSVCLSHLPSLWALLGELSEVDRLLWVLLPVFLSTRLDEEGVCRRLSLRLVDVFTHHSGGLSDRWDENSRRRINTDITDLKQLVVHIIYWFQCKNVIISNNMVSYFNQLWTVKLIFV